MVFSTRSKTHFLLFPLICIIPPNSFQAVKKTTYSPVFTACFSLLLVKAEKVIYTVFNIINLRKYLPDIMIIFLNTVRINSLPAPFCHERKRQNSLLV